MHNLVYGSDTSEVEVAPKIVVWKISSKSHGNGMSKRAAMKLATRQSIVPAAAPSSRPESESHPRFVSVAQRFTVYYHYYRVVRVVVEKVVLKDFPCSAIWWAIHAQNFNVQC